MQTIAITVSDESSLIVPTEFAEFLFLFRGANVALSQVLPKEHHDELKQPTESELQKLKRTLSSFSPKELDSFFDPNRTPDLVQIERISRASPLELVLLGCGGLIVLAVVLSGGRIQLGLTGVKAIVPPLGTGLKRLREAFGLGKTLKVAFGIRELTVKLNKKEFAELMAPVTGSGGFQSFLLGLQNRVNKQTRQLTLSQQDLERIYRHKATPQKGGYQARLQKIFGRVLPDDHSG